MGNNLHIHDLKHHVNMSGGRLTKQRQLILDYLRGVTTHPSAEIVYKDIKKKMPNISLGTVYRNLRYLADHGFILQLTEDDRSRFDGNIAYHLHFICRHCGKIYDIFNTPNILPEYFEELGSVYRVECSVYGKCKKCDKTAPRVKEVILT